MKWLATIVAILLLPFTAFATTPTALDTLPVSGHNYNVATSLSFSYTVPAGGTNKLFLVVWMNKDSVNPTAISLNGTSMLSTVTRVSGSPAEQARTSYYAYLAAPSTGTFSITYAANESGELYVMTLQNAAQSSPIDVSGFNDTAGGSTITTTITTNVGNDFLLSWSDFFNGQTFSSFGAGETNALTEFNDTILNYRFTGSWKAAAASGGSESMTTNISGSTILEVAVVAVKLGAASFNPYYFNDY